MDSFSSEDAAFSAQGRMSPLARRYERARHAWDDWTAEDIAEECAEWPKPEERPLG